MNPLMTEKRQVTSGLYFCQQTLNLGSDRFTNLYWLEIDTRFKFKLVSNTSPLPLKNFQLPQKQLVAGINFGSFFLSDDLHAPYLSFYNLLVSDGNFQQFPSNQRPALSTEDGQISLIPAVSSGVIQIEGKKLTWSLPRHTHSSDITIYGMFDLTIVKSLPDNGQSKRKIVKDSQFIKCDGEELFLVIKLQSGTPTISEITRNVVDLTTCAYVIKGKASLLSKCDIAQTISCLEIEKRKITSSMDICSASFCLGKTPAELENNLFNQLVYPAGGQPKPISSNYLKSWSVILKNNHKTIFFINDARPKIKNQEGITAFELQDILKEKFDYQWACVGDSGQSSKLMVLNGDTREVYGNMHYQNYKGQKPVWDGLNGRSIPVALLAYE